MTNVPSSQETAATSTLVPGGSENGTAAREEPTSAMPNTCFGSQGATKRPALEGEPSHPRVNCHEPRSVFAGCPGGGRPPSHIDGTMC